MKVVRSVRMEGFIWTGYGLLLNRILEIGILSIHFDGDELYALFLFEKSMRDDFSAVHPSQLLFSVSEPGMSSKIKLLDQNYTMMEAFLLEDPDSDYYEEVK